MKRFYQKLITTCLLICSFILLCGLTGCFKIEGTVSGDIQEGVILTLVGEDVVDIVMSDANGDYIFAGLENGNYTVTPSLSGSTDCTFSPKSASVTILDNDATDIDFTSDESPMLCSADGGYACIDIYDTYYDAINLCSQQPTQSYSCEGGDYLGECIAGDIYYGAIIYFYKNIGLSIEEARSLCTTTYAGTWTDM